MDFTGERQIHCCFSEVDKDHIARYVLASSLVKPGDHVADLGCGIGYGTAFLAFATNCALATGFDISDEAIAYAKECYLPRTDRLQFEIRDITESIEQSAYQFVTVFEVVEHVKLADQLIRVISRMLTEDGIAILSTPNQDVLPYDSNEFRFHQRHYTPCEFAELIELNGLEVLVRGSQNGEIIYPFPGNCFNLFICKKKGGTGTINLSKLGADTVFSRTAAMLERTSYILSSAPEPTLKTVRRQFLDVVRNAKTVELEILRLLDENRRRFKPETLGDHPSFSGVLPEISRGKTVSFSFTAKRDNLYQIAVIPATYMNTCAGYLRFRLIDDNGRAWVHKDVHFGSNEHAKYHIDDNILFPLHFKPYTRSKGRKFTAEIEVVELLDNSRLTFYCDENQNENKTCVNVDGNSISATMTFFLYYL